MGKRARKDAMLPLDDAPPPLPSPLHASLLETSSLEALRVSFAAATPFPHAQLSPLCDDARLRAAFAEMLSLHSSLKETDLFKVYQTGDLGAMEAGDTRCPQLLSLRAAIYSPDFRAFVERLTGCGPLSERTDCSCNVYAHGGGLLCHDDVIGTRRVSYVIYLAEPDEGWAAADGGALELFPLSAPATPALYPSARLLPTWNTMALFCVAPGVSFHSVQEVVAPTKLRVSISGWFHAAAPPADSHRASLAQLTAPNGGSGDVAPVTGAPFAPIRGLPPPADDAFDSPPPPFTDDEAFLLAKWVSPEYLDPACHAPIAKRFASASSVRLASFLRPDVAARIAAAVVRADGRDGLGRGRPPSTDVTGEGRGWAGSGPPHMQRYLTFSPPTAAVAAAAADDAADEAGRELHALKTTLFASSAFAKLLTRLAAASPVTCRAEARRFRPGSDYTVAHAGGMAASRPGLLDAVIAFVDDASDADASAWAGGDAGGFECYIEADGDGQGGAADVYTRRRKKGGGGGGGQDNNGEEGEEEEEEEADDLLNVCARSNALSLVHRDEGIMRFVRYVSAAAPGSRWDVSAEYEIVLPSGGDDEDEEGEEDEGLEDDDE